MAISQTHLVGWTEGYNIYRDHFCRFRHGLGDICPKSWVKFQIVELFGIVRRRWRHLLKVSEFIGSQVLGLVLATKRIFAICAIVPNKGPSQGGLMVV